MLNKDIILQQEVLKDLTAEQVQAIETLSKNDENIVLGEKTGRDAQGIETDVLEATGIPKNQGEKYYDYMKRAFADYKNQIDTLSSTNDTLTTQLADGGGNKVSSSQLDAAKQELIDANTRIEAFNTQISNLESDFAAQLAERDKASLMLGLKSEISGATAGLKPKSGYGEDEFLDIVQMKTDRLLQTHEVENIGTATEPIYQWRDKAGKLLVNPQNANNPYSTKELIMREVGNYVDAGKKSTGTGVKGAESRTQSLGSASTKDEARIAIEADLASRGIAKGGDKYQAAFAEMYNTPEVKALPMG